MSYITNYEFRKHICLSYIQLCWTNIFDYNIHFYENKKERMIYCYLLRTL